MEPLIAFALAAEGRHDQKAPLQGFGIIGILKAQRIERAGRRLAPLGEHASRRIADRFAEHRGQLRPGKCRERIQDDAVDEQRLETGGELLLEKAADAKRRCNRLAT